MQDKKNEPSVITSSGNKTFKALMRLIEGRGMKKQERTLVAGGRLVRELVSERPQACCCLIVSEGCACAGMEDVVQQFMREGRLLVLKKELYSRLDLFSTGAPLLEISMPFIPVWDGRLQEHGCMLALPFQDPANVGAAARSAAAFGASHVVLLREAANPFHPKSVRASAGAVFRLSFSRGPSLEELARMQSLSRHIVPLDMQGAAIRDFKFPDRFLLLPGMEGRGLPEGLRQQAVAIPMVGGVESLNAAVALSIALFCWRAGRG